MIDGRVPVNELFDSPNSIRFDNSNRLDGIVPVS